MQLRYTAPFGFMDENEQELIYYRSDSLSFLRPRHMPSQVLLQEDVSLRSRQGDVYVTPHHSAYVKQVFDIRIFVICFRSFPPAHSSPSSDRTRIASPSFAFGEAR